MPENSQTPSQMPYPQYYPPQKKTNWWIPVLIIGLVFVLIITFFVAIFSALSSPFDKEPVYVRDNSVLYLDLRGNIQEYSKSNPFAEIFGAGQISYADILHAVKTAKYDDKIDGIYIRGGVSGMGMAKAAELQQEILDFKESGKFVYAFMEIGSEGDYFNALPADSIFMPAEGILEMNGYGASVMFMKGLFDKIGIDFHVEHFEDFKSAGETYNRKSFSDSARYQLQVMLQQRQEQYNNAVAKFRDLPIEKVHEVIAEGTYTAEKLHEYGFIDALLTESDVKSFIKDKIFGDDNNDSRNKLKMLTADKYIQSDLPIHGTIADKDKRIAIIYGSGVIQDMAPDSPFDDELKITTKKFVSYLRKAREDDDVKAIILRIDSPGGSVIASDAIWQEVMLTKKVKPVYASMSDVAASGGYYIPMACDTIIAHPSTITGSIGVVATIPNMAGLMDKLGLTVDTVSSSPNAQFLNPMLPFRNADMVKFHKMSEKIYKRFLTKVSESRGMTYDEVRAIARGRVWTGKDAKRIGLVDVLGGFDEALKIAKRRIGVPDTMKVFVQTYPGKGDEIEELLKMFGLNTGSDEDVQTGNFDAKTELARLMGVEPDMVLSTLNSLPPSARKQLIYAYQILQLSGKEKVMAAMPYYPSIDN